MWGRVWGTEKGEGKVWPFAEPPPPPKGLKGGFSC